MNSRVITLYPVKMFKHVPWASHGDEQEKTHATDKEEESLTSILDEDQCGELTLLIATAAASMRKTMEMNFDASVRLLRKLIPGSMASDPKCRRLFPSTLSMSSHPKMTKS